jgi:hypothetical protein
MLSKTLSVGSGYLNGLSGLSGTVNHVAELCPKEDTAAVGKLARRLLGVTISLKAYSQLLPKMTMWSP